MAGAFEWQSAMQRQCKPDATRVLNDEDRIER